MELFRDTHIDFMKYRRFWIIFSAILVLGGLYAIFGPHRLNMGIDFAGGTQITLGFNQQPDVDRIRRVLERQGLKAPEIVRYGNVSQNEVLVKTPVIKGSEEGSRDRIIKALNDEFNQGKPGLDINQAGVDSLTAFLLQADPDHVGSQGPEAARAHYAAVSGAILAERHKALFKSLDRVDRVPGVSPATAATLQAQSHIGNFSVLAFENVGPQVGSELRHQGFLAVIASMIGMLLYIWFRFELRFGIGAVMASLHDVVVTLLFYWAFGYEFNLTTIAAFLTLIGYSMNDTVVIFDRMRENMRKTRRKPLIEVMNDSINQTLSRTIMTSGLTFLTVLSLLILGGPVLRGFAFVMTVGIIVGTYSSIYVASPFALLWESLFGAQGRWRKDKGAPVRGGGGAGADGQRSESRIDRTAGPADSRNRPSSGGSSNRPARRRA
jgi:preprotein translocase subunit SecF